MLTPSKHYSSAVCVCVCVCERESVCMCVCIDVLLDERVLSALSSALEGTQLTTMMSV